MVQFRFKQDFQESDAHHMIKNFSFLLGFHDCESACKILYLGKNPPNSLWDPFFDFKFFSKQKFINLVGIFKWIQCLMGFFEKYYCQDYLGLTLTRFGWREFLKEIYSSTIFNKYCEQTVAFIPILYLGKLFHYINLFLNHYLIN